jgi:hypothetical protein
MGCTINEGGFEQVEEALYKREPCTDHLALFTRPHGRHVSKKQLSHQHRSPSLPPSRPTHSRHHHPPSLCLCLHQCHCIHCCIPFSLPPLPLPFHPLSSLPVCRVHIHSRVPLSPPPLPSPSRSPFCSPSSLALLPPSCSPSSLVCCASCSHLWPLPHPLPSPSPSLSPLMCCVCVCICGGILSSLLSLLTHVCIHSRVHSWPFSGAPSLVFAFTTTPHALCSHSPPPSCLVFAFTTPPHASCLCSQSQLCPCLRLHSQSRPCPCLCLHSQSRLCLCSHSGSRSPLCLHPRPVPCVRVRLPLMFRLDCVCVHAPLHSGS